MDIDASIDFKMATTTMVIKYKLVPPSNHRAKNIEKYIQTSKNHFISGLFRLDQDSCLQLWGKLPHQATISLNFHRRSRISPCLSAYTNIFLDFDYNPTRLSSPGTKIEIQNMTIDRSSWAPHREYGWYIGP